MPSFSTEEGQSGCRPLAGDVGTQGVEAFDEPEVALALEREPGRQGEVAPAALPGDDDPSRVDAEVRGMRSHPAQAGHAIVQAGGEGCDLRRRRGRDAVAEIHHDDHDAVGGNVLAPAPVHPVEAGHGGHAATVDVIDPRQSHVGLGPDDLQLHRVAVGVRGELRRGDRQAGRRSGLLGIAQVLERPEGFPGLDGLRGVRLRQELLAVRHVAQWLRRDEARGSVEGEGRVVRRVRDRAS